MPTTLRQEVLNVLAEMDEWLGNDEGLMIEDVVAWRDSLAAAVGKSKFDAPAPPAAHAAPTE